MVPVESLECVPVGAGSCSAGKFKVSVTRLQLQ